jgi:hypothetical protein
VDVLQALPQLSRWLWSYPSFTKLKRYLSPISLSATVVADCGRRLLLPDFSLSMPKHCFPACSKKVTGTCLVFSGCGFSHLDSSQGRIFGLFPGPLPYPSQDFGNSPRKSVTGSSIRSAIITNPWVQ